MIMTNYLPSLSNDQDGFSLFYIALEGEKKAKNLMMVTCSLLLLLALEALEKRKRSAYFLVPLRPLPLEPEEVWPSGRVIN